MAPSRPAHLGRFTTALLLAAVVVAIGLPGTSFAAVQHRRAVAVTAVQHGWPTMRLGSSGQAVRELQKRLAWALYLPWGSAIDGHFGWQTWHAVVAFQGWNHLNRDGVVGPATRAALSHAQRPQAWSGTTGFEIHLTQQVVLLIRDRRVVRAVHVSTGAPGRSTPTGFFHVYRRETMSWSVPFQTWMPLAQYFSGGYAMHEYPSVPAYPASHGCVRVPESESHAVWNFGYIGIPVRVLSA